MPGNKPHQPNRSMAQQRMKFVLAREGKMSYADAIGAARASKGMKLPGHVKSAKKVRFKLK